MLSLILKDYSFWKRFHTMYMLHVHVTFVEIITGKKICLINVQLFLQISRLILTYNSLLTKIKKTPKFIYFIAFTEFSLVLFHIILGALIYFIPYALALLSEQYAIILLLKPEVFFTSLLLNKLQLSSVLSKF